MGHRFLLTALVLLVLGFSRRAGAEPQKTTVGIYVNQVGSIDLGMIAMSLLSTVAVLSLHYRGLEAVHRRVDRAGSIAFPVLYVLLLFSVVR